MINKNHQTFHQMGLLDFDDDIKPFKIDKPIRLIELFAGIGAQAKALENLGVNFEHYKICEFDPYAVKSYNAVHKTNFETSDITKITADDLNIVDTDKYEYIMTYSFPCGLRGEKIKTETGYKNIEDVEVGDYVLTHTNTYKKVVKTMTRQTQGYYRIKYIGGESLLTSEHPLYVYRDSKFQWIKVKDLKLTDKVSFNVNTKEIDVDLSNEYLWLLGRYVADGWVNKYLYNSVEFAVGNKKEDEFLNKIPQDFRGRFKKFQKPNTCIEYRLADKEFQKYCLEFGQGAKNKRIPEWVLNLPKSKLQSFFDGYISGDGHIRFKGKSKEIMFSTTSFELFLGLQAIIAKLYSKICSMYIRKNNRKTTFNDMYNCQVVLSSNSICQEVIGDKIVTRISKIEYIDELVDVFNFEVETDNSYTINNIIVHNCQDLSLAGKQKGMKKGEGTRSGLLWEVERLLRELNQKGKNHLPTVLLLENVAQLLSYKNRLDFDDWCHFLSSLGYENYYKILNAKDFGIPQNRERCFMVSILGDGYYTFPKPKKLTICLKDMLEQEVDEKYFLSADKIKSIANWKAQQDPLKDIDKEKKISPTLTARGAGEEHSGMVLINEDVEFSDSIPIKEATKKGYSLARDGDGVYTNRVDVKRGTVQKGMIQTIKTSVDDIGVVVKDTKNEDTLKHQLCNELIESGLVKENDVIRHNYTDFKYKNNNIVVSNNECPTLDTRPDCLGVVVKDELIKVGEMTGGKWDKINESCRRVYDPDGIAPTLTTCGGGNQEIKICQKVSDIGVSPTTTTRPEEFKIIILPVVKDEKNVYTCASRGRDPENPNNRSSSAKLQQRIEVGSSEVSNTITTVQKDSLLLEEYLGTFDYNSSDTFVGDNPRAQFGSECISTLRTSHQDGLIIGSTQKHADVRTDGICPSLTSAMGMGGGQVPMHTYNLRIRKLTPKECWRLMGFDDIDFDNAKKALNDTFYNGEDRSNSQLYKQAGNSIVVNVLMAIFKQML